MSNSSINSAVAEWNERATKIGGRDTMLNFRDSREGSLDLSGAHPSGVAQLLAGRATRLSSLIRNTEQLADARRRVKSIRHKADQLSYERGIHTAHLAIGFAQWSRDIDGTRTDYSAPILLRHVELVPRGTNVEDFEITLANDTVVNPALVEYLHKHHNVHIDTDEWIASTQESHGFDPTGVYKRLRTATRSVPGLLVTQRLVVSTFANITTPFGRDDLPLDHPVVRALAGDADARRSLSRGGSSDPAPAPTAGGGKGSAEVATTSAKKPGLSAGVSDANTKNLPTLGANADSAKSEDAGSTLKTSGEKKQKRLRKRRELRSSLDVQTTPRLPDRSPSSEFLALDVDGDQQAVVDAALAGESFVVDTPPGTGATQVATALATSLAHAGKSVLYVAQSSDALDDYAKRLDDAGVRNFVVDGRERMSDLKKQLVSLIISAERSSKPDLNQLLQKLTYTRERLNAHTASLHQKREPWGTSVFATLEHLAALTASDPGPLTDVRFDDRVMKLDSAGRDTLRGDLLKLSDLGAFTMDVEDTVWFGARFANDEDAETARATAERAARLVTELTKQAEPVLRAAGMNPARNVDAWGKCLETIVDVSRMLKRFTEQVFDANLEELIAATGTGKYRRQHNIDQGMFERARLKKEAAALARGPIVDLHEELQGVRKLRDQWYRLTRDTSKAPHAVDGADEAFDVHQELDIKLRQLDPIMDDTPDGGNLGRMLVEELQARLSAMGEDRAALADLPARTSADDKLREAGLGDLLDDLRARKVRHAGVGAEFDLAYWATVLQQMAAADALISGHDTRELDDLVREFREADREFVKAGGQRLMYAHAAGWRRAIASFKAEAEIVRIALRAPHLHLQQLALEAPRVLSALAPVWMMSPFEVPNVFAAQEFFDVVIVADAARLSVPEALPAIARARQVVALGDSRLPGPKPFSVSVNRHAAPTQPSSTSVFTELAEFLPLKGLRTYHRAAPQGLLDLVNGHFYDSAISSLPTARTSEGTGLEFAYVPDATGVPDSVTGQVESPDQEVSRVVDLVLRHARTKPRQSLAVITLTPWHAQRVASAVQSAIRQYPYVASFFTDTTKEPFVVTDVERVQGFARDAVIFSVGYGRTLQGRVLYNFGSLEEPDSEKLLAAIVTRARRKLTLVSSYGPTDLERSRLKHGSRYLLELITAVVAASRSEAARGGEQGSGAASSRGAGAGTGTGAGSSTDAPSPLVVDIAERMRKLGAHPIVNYNGIDIAVPVGKTVEQGMVLAIETDGPAYASTPSVRERERLRRDSLERRGWTCARMWSMDAFVNPQAVAQRMFDLWRESVEAHSPQSVLDAARAASVVTGRRGSRPQVAPGLPLHAYSESDLHQMLEWIQSDNQFRDDTELEHQLKNALAYRGHTDLNDTIAKAVRRYREAQARAKAVFEEQPRESSEGGRGGEEQELGQDAIMPTYDTGVLRDEDLIDAGLREDEREGTGESASEREGERDDKRGDA